MTDKTKFNGWTPKIVTSKAKVINETVPYNDVLEANKTKMLEICINKNGSVEHINGLPKGYGYYVKRIK